jgi:hypothetical protein
MNVAKKLICHQELWTSLEFEGVQAWKWHHLVGCRLHPPPYVWGMNNKIKCLVSFVGTQDHMGLWIEIETMVMPIKLGVNSKHEESWNTRGSCGWNTWFHVLLFWINDLTFQKHQ